MRRLMTARTLTWTALVVVASGLGAAVKFAPGAPAVAATLARIDDMTMDISAAVGLRLAALTVEGRAMTPRDDLLDALNIERGAPILDIDVAQARAAIEALPWVKTAKVERRLPDSVHILLQERSAYALWQQGHRYTLVDRDGKAIVDVPDAPPSLPLIVGPDAPKHAAALFEALDAEPELAGRVRAAVRVGARRWNVYLDAYEGGIAVRLPENDVAAAWARLAVLERDHRILERDLDFIDLRLEDRLVVRIHKQPEPVAAPAAGKPKPSVSAPLSGTGPKQDI